MGNPLRFVHTADWKLSVRQAEHEYTSHRRGVDAVRVVFLLRELASAAARAIQRAMVSVSPAA